jgi:hypothetical protein
MSELPGDEARLDSAEQRLGEQLAAQRPPPAAGFRGALRRRLVAEDPGYGPRPPRLRLTVGGWLAGGALLIALGALQATGAV